MPSDTLVLGGSNVTKVVMPRYGANMEEGLIGEWFTEVGQKVEKDQKLFSVEIEKLTNEVLSPCEGYVASILFEEGDSVPCSQTVCILTESADESIEEPGGTEVVSEIEDPIQELPVQEERDGQESGSTVISADRQKLLKVPVGRRPVTPKAAQLAHSLKVSLEGIEGTGRLGMITREDVRRAQTQGATRPLTESVQAESVAAAQKTSEKPTSLKGARKVIAQRMSESLATAAQAAIWMDADVTGLMEAYRRAKGAYVQRGVRLTVTSCILQALSKVIADHPVVRMQLTSEGTVRILQRINIAIAVDTPAGLMVPVICDCDRKSVSELASELSALSDAARTGTLEPSAASEHVMTLSNLGSYGVTYSRPILNLPESAIIGTGAIEKRPVYIDGGLFARDILPLSMSFDHRLIDGSPAAAFLKDFRLALESFRLD